VRSRSHTPANRSITVGPVVASAIILPPHAIAVPQGFRCVMFPTLLSDVDNRPIGAVPYCVSFERLAGFSFAESALTTDGFRVYGISLDSGRFPATGRDAYVYAFYARGDRLFVYPCEAPSGHSADLAVWLLSRLTRTPEALFTGAIVGGVLIPILGLAAKDLLAWALPLYAPNKDPWALAHQVGTLGQALRAARQQSGCATPAGQLNRR